VYLFEENARTYLNRAESIGIPVREMIDRGTLETQVVDALNLSPQEFAEMVRADVEANDTRIVMIDGIAGYRLTLRGETDSVTTILIDETRNVTGEFMPTEENISYLADNIVFLRHLEIQGELRKAIGVLKKRTSDFERTLREFRITPDGIEVGEPLTGMRGILRGTPERVDD
jgi:circadian clock protein KaiC